MSTGPYSGSVAYLAPEIPGLSSTFVYNEIIELKKLGIDVAAFSLHSVCTEREDQDVREIAESCTYLYRQPAIQLIQKNLTIFAAFPRRYITSLWKCVKDSAKCLYLPRVAAGLIYRFLISGYLAQALVERKVTHLHCHFSHISTDVGMYASLISGIPFSFTAHANDIFERAYLLKEKGHRAKFVATISIFNIEALKAKGIAEEKLALVRCGVDTSKFSPRSTLTRNEEKKKIGFLGRLVEKKGIDLLIDALRILIDQGENIELEIMGDGPMIDALIGQANRLGLSRHIHFGGALRHDQVATWFECIDYFAFPGKMDANGDMDGIPVVLMEAMMRGVPVIATEVSGIPELVRDKQTGYLAQPHPEDIARAISNAISESEGEISEKIQRAISLVATEFNLSENAKLLTRHIYAHSNFHSCRI